MSCAKQQLQAQECDGYSVCQPQHHGTRAAAAGHVSHFSCRGMHSTMPPGAIHRVSVRCRPRAVQHSREAAVQREEASRAWPQNRHTSCSVMSGRTSNTTAALHSRHSGSRSYLVVSV